MKPQILFFARITRDNLVKVSPAFPSITALKKYLKKFEDLEYSWLQIIKATYIYYNEHSVQTYTEETIFDTRSQS